MKKVYNYTFQLVCVYIVVLSIFSIFNIKLEVDKNSASIVNNSKDKMLESTILVQNYNANNNLLLPKEEKVNENKETKVKEKNITVEKKVEEPKQEQVIEPKQEEVKEEPKEEVQEQPKEIYLPQNMEAPANYQVLASENVNISHYGPDCQGCGNGETAAGYNVSNGRLTYEDPTYGTLRIVAADKKYPLGTVIRLSQGDFNVNAIVLDRGGGIGDGKKYQIDLLIESETVCNKYSVYYGATLEVLRYGY